jgi:hypothetical protein
MLREEPDKPFECHDAQDHRPRGQQAETRDGGPHHECAGAMRAHRVRHEALDEHQVAGIRLPAEVEEIAQHGNGSDREIDGDVAEHADENKAGRAEARRDGDDVTRERGARDVAEAGDEPEQRIEPDAKARARNADRAVQQARQGTRPLQGVVYLCSPRDSTSASSCSRRTAPVAGAR